MTRLPTSQIKQLKTMQIQQFDTTQIKSISKHANIKHTPQTKLQLINIIRNFQKFLQVVLIQNCNKFKEPQMQLAIKFAGK